MKLIPNNQFTPENGDADYILGREGILYLDNEIDEHNVTPIIKQIIAYNLLPVDLQPKQITFYISTGGGQVQTAFELVEIIRQSKIPVVTIGIGLIGSAGIYVLSSGHKRYATTYALIHSHQFSGSHVGKEDEMKYGLKRIQLTSSAIFKMMKKFTGKSESYLRKYLFGSGEYYYTAWEALEHGLIDGVIKTI